MKHIYQQLQKEMCSKSHLRRHCGDIVIVQLLSVEEVLLGLHTINHRNILFAITGQQNKIKALSKLHKNKPLGIPLCWTTRYQVGCMYPLIQVETHLGGSKSAVV